MDTFSSTPERDAIVEELRLATKHSAKAAELMSQAGYSVRADKARDVAQQAVGLESLLALDFHDEDAGAATSLSPDQAA